MERIIKLIETILSIALFLSVFLIISFVVYKCRNTSEASTDSLFHHASPPDPDYEDQPIGIIAYFQQHGRFPPPRPAPDPIQPRAWRENELRRHEGPLPAPRSPPPPSSPRVEDYLSSPAEGQYNGLVPRNGPRHIWDLRQNPARRRENPWALPNATNEEGHRPEDGEQQHQQQQQKATLDSGNNTTPAGADDSARATEPRRPEQRQPARSSAASEPSETEDDVPTTSLSVADVNLRSDLQSTTTPSPDKVADKTTVNTTTSPPVTAAAQTAKMPSMGELYHLPPNILLQMSHSAGRDQVGCWLKSVNGTPEHMMALAADVKLTWLDNVRLVFFFWYQWACMQGDASWDLQKLDKADIEVAAPVVDNVLASLQAFARQYTDNADYLDQIIRNVQKVQSGMRCGLQAAHRLEAAIAQINQQRIEQQRLEQQRLEEIRQEQYRLEQQYLEQQKLEQQRFEEHHLQQQRLEAQRLAQQQQLQREQELQCQQEQERRIFRNEAQKQKKHQRDEAESAEPERQRKALPTSEEERAKREEDAMIAEVQEELQRQQNNAPRASKTETKQEAGRKRKAAEYTEQQPQHQSPSALEEQQKPEQKQSDFTPFVPPPTANQRDWVPPYKNAPDSTKAPLPFKKPQASGSWTPPPASRPAAQYASGSQSTFPPGYQPSGLRLQVPGPSAEDDDDDGYES